MTAIIPAEEAIIILKSSSKNPLRAFKEYKAEMAYDAKKINEIKTVRYKYLSKGKLNSKSTGLKADNISVLKK